MHTTNPTPRTPPPPQAGVRQYCGHSLPEGLIKNQKLEHNLLTPTTKVSMRAGLLEACVDFGRGELSSLAPNTGNPIHHIYKSPPFSSFISYRTTHTTS